MPDLHRIVLEPVVYARVWEWDSDKQDYVPTSQAAVVADFANALGLQGRRGFAQSTERGLYVLACIDCAPMEENDEKPVTRE